MLWAELTFEWYEGAMVFRVLTLFLLFRTNGKKWHLDENNFHTIKAVFSKVPFWKGHYSYVQSFFSTILRHIDKKKKVFWKTPYNWMSECFTDMDQNKFLLFHQDFSSKQDETKINKAAWKIISCTKIRAFTWKNIAPK